MIVRNPEMLVQGVVYYSPILNKAGKIVGLEKNWSTHRKSASAMEFGRKLLEAIKN